MTHIFDFKIMNLHINDVIKVHEIDDVITYFIFRLMNYQYKNTVSVLYMHMMTL